MIGQLRVVKCDQVLELGKVFLNHSRIVFKEEIVQVFWNEGRQTGVSLSYENKRKKK